MTGRPLEGSVAVVTGAGSGIGRATALLCAEQGAAVAVLDRNGPAAKATADEIQAGGGSSVAVDVDVSEPASVERAVGAVRASLGPVDILVNAAGVPAGGPLEGEAFLDDWQRSMDINLDGAMHLVRACQADLERRGMGRIVNVASTEALGAGPRSLSYTVAKHGVLGLTRALAVELGRRGVTANCVCPGATLTGMTEAIPAEDRDRFARRAIPVGRYGRPEEIAHMIVALVAPAASFVNGAVIAVDGGMTARSR